MARTRAGATQTDIHRRRQVALATASQSEVRRSLRYLDLADLDGSMPAWLAQTTEIVGRYYARSSSEAQRYLSGYRLAEIGTETGPIVAPNLPATEVFAQLTNAGPVSIKAAIKVGVSAEVAYSQAVSQVIAEAEKLILSGGRGVVRESGRADGRAIGYRRKSDGDPCAFCGLLVSRGPAYTSEAKALSKAGGTDPYHLHCGCTVEILYSPWQPTEAEQVMVDTYFKAAADLRDEGFKRSARNVLERMRRDGGFRDSPARRNKAEA